MPHSLTQPLVLVMFQLCIQILAVKDLKQVSLLVVKTVTQASLATMETQLEYCVLMVSYYTLTVDQL